MRDSGEHDAATPLLLRVLWVSGALLAGGFVGAWLIPILLIIRGLIALSLVDHTYAREACFIDAVLVT